MSIFRMLVVLGLAGFGELAVGKDVLLVFTAEGCRPCQKFKRDLVENPEMLKDYEVSTLDLEKAEEIAKDFEVKSVPTFIVVKVAEDEVIKKVNVVKKEVGYTTLERFQRWLKR